MKKNITGNESQIGKWNVRIILSFIFFLAFSLSFLFISKIRIATRYNSFAYPSAIVHLSSHVSTNIFFFSSSVNNGKNLTREIIAEPEGHIEDKCLEVICYRIFSGNIYKSILQRLDKVQSTLPSLFFKRESPVSLFILYNSMKDLHHV